MVQELLTKRTRPVWTTPVPRGHGNTESYWDTVGLLGSGMRFTRVLDEYFGDLDAKDLFLQAVRAGKLLSPELTSAFLSPQVLHRTGDTWTEMYGYGLQFRVEGPGKVVCYEKDGVNVGVSGMISHYPEQDVTVTLLSNMEDGVWDPIDKIHELVVDSQAT